MIIAAGGSTGIGISRAKILKSKVMGIDAHDVKNTDSEIAKLELCIKSAIDELNETYQTISHGKNDLIAGIIEKYINIISSRQLVEDIKAMIIKKGVTAEYAISKVLDDSKNQIKKLDEQFLSEKTGDIEEIKTRLLGKLKRLNIKDWPDIQDDCIIVAEDLTAGDVFKMDPSVIKGIVTIYGGPTSSCSVIARRKKIPAVSGVGPEGYFIKEGDMLIVDGNAGKVLINPSENVILSYMKTIKQ
jgi:phosphotransferase system enzyme I (PtsI)